MWKRNNEGPSILSNDPWCKVNVEKRGPSSVAKRATKAMSTKFSARLQSRCSQQGWSSRHQLMENSRRMEELLKLQLTWCSEARPGWQKNKSVDLKTQSSRRRSGRSLKTKVFRYYLVVPLHGSQKCSHLMVNPERPRMKNQERDRKLHGDDVEVALDLHCGTLDAVVRGMTDGSGCQHFLLGVR